MLNVWEEKYTFLNAYNSTYKVSSFRPVVPKVSGTEPLGVVRNSGGEMKHKWAIGGW